MKELYFDKTTNKYCLEQTKDTVLVQVDPNMVSDTIHEYYRSNDDRVWSYAYTTAGVGREMVDWNRDRYMEKYGINKEEFSLFRIVISKDTYDYILYFLKNRW